jgi:DNA (cytosine-5)-methyltransferase 1
VQFILVVNGGETGIRGLSPREYERLMGLEDSYILPVGGVEARSLCGHGVVVPVVRFLSHHILEPCLALAWAGSRAGMKGSRGRVRARG